jgi:signal transduction histidine kinase
MFKKLRLSIFLKLVVIVFLTLAAMDLSMLYVLRFVADTKPRKVFPHYVRRLERLLVNDIGYPPDTLKAKDVAQDLEMNIRFQSHDFNWTTSAEVPTLEELARDEDFNDRFPYRDQFRVNYEDRPYTIVKNPKGIYILQLMIPGEFYNPEITVLLLIYVVSFITIVFYLVLRWLFRPLKVLSAGVHEIGKGNYDINIPIKRKDELGELGKSLNEMTSSIKRSIKSKEQLLIDVSHELRSPLTRIKLGLEVGSPKETISEDVNEMENMITGLLENYRAESEHYKLNIENTDIIKLTKDIVSGFSDSERIRLSLPEKQSIFCKLDSDRAKLVLRNVIDNALKFSTGKIDINITEYKNSVVASIKDSGVGISSEDLKYIFEPFYRSDPSRSRKTGGFGLGLSICKKIMDAHKGKIEISSKLNEWTEVILEFPA